MRPPSHFGNDITNTTPNDGNNNNSGSGDDNNNNSNSIVARLTEMGATMMFPKIAGRGIIRVVERCDDAKENNNLDLSECELIQVPDAVYHLMRHTELKTCDLSGNVITKISPKFAIKFSLITDLNLSHNQMAKLPDELADLHSLEMLDISFNSFITLPAVVFKMPKLRMLMANNNAIIDIDRDEIITSDSLEVVDLRHNPLMPICYELLRNANVSFRIELSERAKEEWEDLTI
ncbi:leucine-rich repeat-containing protein 20 [Toxorhynchites rutilus septentrionalis]|uniref:leucine-rich repeat-containing protein 20 n=1 Tax=Toxorhynchites rutilus septentrionalis TaxID=329112 RepID=UPI00247B00A0|nr:leucine-rich repeat-containing protein 20 [Toxorhynchites rutilus septentrionalis]